MRLSQENYVQVVNACILNGTPIYIFDWLCVLKSCNHKDLQ